MNIENKKQLATLLLAVGLGLVAAFLASQYVQKNIEKQTQVLAAEYEKKSQAVVQEVELLKREMRNAIAQQIAAIQKQGAAQETAKEQVDTGTFSVRTPQGKRALTISIDSLSAVGGLLNPGDFVDIIGHLKIPSKSDPKAEPQQVVSVLFQNIQVLAVGSNFKPTGNSSIYESQQRTANLNVTLAMDPQEAGLLTFVQGHGRIQFTLRSPVEREAQPLEAASWDALAEYVQTRQGTNLMVPKSRAVIEAMGDGQIRTKTMSEEDEIKPVIQIFKAGKEL